MRQQGFDFALPEPMPAHCPTSKAGAPAPWDPNVDPADVDRLKGQNAAILALLRSKPEVSNVEIAAMGVLKHTSRISDLRIKGRLTINARRGKDGVWWYSLEEPQA
jgi:hypothetical protein